jgi:hypothetical protein
LDTLQTSLCNSHAHPARHLLAQGIKHWSLNRDNFIPDIAKILPHLGEPIRTALESQQAIGWEQATKGFLSKQWMDLSLILIKPVKNNSSQ